MAIIIKDKEITDFFSLIGNEKGEIIKTPVEFVNCTFKEELDLVNTQFEKWLSFCDCTFEKSIFFGKLNSHLHSSQLKQDLVFINCNFECEARFDGIDCDGSVTFEHCWFNHESQNEQDFALSLQAAYIRVNLSISYCTFNGGGISLNSAKIERIGCHINCVKLVSLRGVIDFIGAHLGDEFAIQGCELTCKRISFQLVSVNPKGHVKIDGKTILTGCSAKEVAFRAFDDYIFDKQIDLSYVKEDIQRDYLLFCYYFDGCIYYCIKVGNEIYNINDPNYNDVNRIKEAVLKDDKEFIWFYCTRDNQLLLNTEISVLFTRMLVPIVERWSVNKGEDTLGYLCICDGEVYFKKEEEDEYETIGDVYDGLKPFFFSDSLSEQIETKTFGDLHCYLKKNKDHIHSVFPFIYKEGNELVTSFKLTVPTILGSLTEIEFISISSGCRFHLENVIIQAYSFNIDRLTALDDISIIYSHIDAANVKLNNMRSDEIGIHMSSLNYEPNDSNGFVLNNDHRAYVGMFLTGIQTEKLGLYHLHVGTSTKVFNIVFSIRDARVRGQFVIDTIYCQKTSLNDGPNILFDLQDSEINCLTNYNILTQKNVNYLITGLKVEDIRMEFSMFARNGNYLPESYEKICKLVDDSVFIGNAIPILRRIGTIYEENDKQEQANKLWKYRNKLRIKQKYSKSWSKIVILWNNLFTDYGLSTWRLLLWLIGFMVLFDVITGFAFGLSFGSAFANGFVEFIPINFNEPVVDAIRDKSIVDKFGYGVAVVVYRLLSYIILSVLIASLTGYFNKKNK